MLGYFLALALCVAALAMLIWLMRKGRLREKYAALWLLLILGVCIIGAIPDLMFWIAEFVGVQTPSNLLFAVALVVLFFVCIQLSTEASGLEEEVRTVAEEVALTKLEVEQLKDRLAAMESLAEERPADSATREERT